MLVEWNEGYEAAERPADYCIRRPGVRIPTLPKTSSFDDFLAFVPFRSVRFIYLRIFLYFPAAYFYALLAASLRAHMITCMLLRCLRTDII